MLTFTRITSNLKKLETMAAPLEKRLFSHLHLKTAELRSGNWAAATCQPSKLRRLLARRVWQLGLFSTHYGSVLGNLQRYFYCLPWLHKSYPPCAKVSSYKSCGLWKVWLRCYCGAYVTLFGKTRLNEISVEPFLHLNAFSNVENALEIIFNAF